MEYDLNCSACGWKRLDSVISVCNGGERLWADPSESISSTWPSLIMCQSSIASMIPEIQIVDVATLL